MASSPTSNAEIARKPHPPNGLSELRMRIRVKVNASSKTEGVRRLEPGYFQVRTRAPAERGRANARVLQLLAEELGVAAERLRIVTGGTQPLKVIEILDE